MHFLVSSCSKKCAKSTQVSCFMSQKSKEDPREFKHLLKHCVGPGMALPLTGLWWQSHSLQQPCWGHNPSIQTRSCPDHAPPQLLVLLLTSRARETGVSLAWGKAMQQQLRHHCASTIVLTLSMSTWHWTSC